MKALAATALAIGLIVAPTVAAQIDRADVARTVTTPAAKNPVTDFSAKRHKRRAVLVRPVLIAPSHPVWQGADPTKGPGIGQLRELQREGRCVIDEGYGRYMGCSSM